MTSSGLFWTVCSLLAVAALFVAFYGLCWLATLAEFARISWLWPLLGAAGLFVLVAVCATRGKGGTRDD